MPLKQRPLNKSGGAPANNTKTQAVAVVNITDETMFKVQQLELEGTCDTSKPNTEEEEALRKAKEEEAKYKKQMEALQLEERKQLEEKLTEEERIYAEQKRIEEEKRQKRAEKLEKILNFDDDDDSVGDLDLDSEGIFSDSEEDELSLDDYSQ